MNSNRPGTAKRVFKKRRPPLRWKQLGSGLLMIALGVGLLLALMQLPERLDTLLLVSTAIANLIGGMGRFLVGLLQLLGVLMLVLVAIGSLLLLAIGSLRLVRGCLGSGPRPIKSRPVQSRR